MLQDRPNISQLAMMRGRPVYGSDGGKLGDLEDIYYDDATGEAEWLGVGTGGILGFGAKRVLVPLEGAQVEDGDNLSVRVPYSKDQVKGTPEIDTDVISEETERELYAHYGLKPSERRSESQLPEGQMPRQQATGREGEASVTRREEELQVGKRETERGRVRLRKWVETEPATAEVETRRETAHVEREPVDRPVSGAEARLGEQEAEITLHEEEPVVGKEVTEKERVTLRPEEEVRQETVRDEIRKEHVEVEDDVEDEDVEGDQGRRRR